MTIRSFRKVATICAALAAGTMLGAAGKPAPAPRTAGANWNATVTRTPEGGLMMGNPAAKVKLVEFVSYTCNHCAQFEREAADQLRLGLVAPGKGSVEVRSFVRDPIDMTIALLTRCGPKEKFFANHTTFLRKQDTWIKPLMNASQSQRQRWSTGELGVRLRFIASDLRFYDIMQTLGYNRQSVDRCLANTALVDQLARQTKEAADRFHINGTPTFMIDGIVLAGTHDWRSLRPQLEARTH